MGRAEAADESAINDGGIHNPGLSANFGGDPADPHEAFASWEKALALPSVRGLIVGRTMLYPADDDVSSAVAAAVAMVRTWAAAATGTE